MDRNSAVGLYFEVCERWRTAPTQKDRERWETDLKDINEDEAREAIESHARSKYGNRIPYSTNIYKLAMAQRKVVQSIESNSLSSSDPYPSAAEDNRHFLEWMAAEEGRTPEEMERHINEFMNEWEKNR